MAGVMGREWVFQATAWALGGGGTLLLLWALHWDRARGRWRCPRCWYSMAGAVADAGGAGNLLARPLSQRWRASYGEVLRQSWSLYQRWQGLKNPDGTPASDELAAAVEGLFAIPYTLKARTRERWPEGMPPLVEFKIE